MIIFSINRKHKDMSLYYTQRCREAKIKGIHNTERVTVLNKFYAMVEEDILINFKTVKLPIGTIRATVRPTVKGRNNINFIESTDLKNNRIYYDAIDTEGLSPFIKLTKTKKISKLSNWKFKLQRGTMSKLSKLFKANYKQFIR